jgi:hypothetical protein
MTDPCQSLRPPHAGVWPETAIGPVSAVNTAGTSKIRLVVGLISTPEEFARALDDLGARHLGSAQMRVIGQTDALGGALGRWPERADAQGFSTWVVCRPAEGSLPWAFHSGGSEPLSAAEQDARALLGLHQWALRRQAQQLDRHLRAGGALLLVEPRTDAEEWEASTALLRHASGGVQTHEIARLKSISDGAA